MQAQGGLSIEQMCHLGGVSRAGFYRRWREAQPQEEEMETRAALQQIALRHRGNYGYRRIARELRDRGLAVNHKRVLRLMRTDNLLVVRGRKYIFTTDSRHNWPVYVNLAARLEWNGINQLWVADLTYIRLREQFVYWAVVLDAFSRRIIGWAVDDSLHAALARRALEKAVRERQPGRGVVHHSDRGIQYACADYMELLEKHGRAASMSRKGNPYDNARCESFLKTLKQEEIYTRQYRDRADLETHLESFLEEYYNRERLHSALNYCSPEQFENSLQPRPSGYPAAQMSFFRHEEIYRSDVGEGNLDTGRSA